MHVLGVRADLARGVQPGHAGHRDVEHGHVGVLGQRALHRLDAVLGLGRDLHVGLALDQHRQAGADDAVVVCDQDADHGSLSVTSVPAPGEERRSSSPPTSRARSAMPVEAQPAVAAGGHRVEARGRRRGR